MAYLLIAGIAALIGLYLIGRQATKASSLASAFTLDQSTPQGALRLFQAAVAARDLDAMVAVKDFEYEARQILLGKGPDIGDDPTVVAKTAETLEAAFRAEWQNREWPDLTGTVTYYSNALPVDSNTVQVAEVIRYPTGVQERSLVKLVRRGPQWRAVHGP